MADTTDFFNDPRDRELEAALAQGADPPPRQPRDAEGKFIDPHDMNALLRAAAVGGSVSSMPAGVAAQRIVAGPLPAPEPVDGYAFTAAVRRLTAAAPTMEGAARQASERSPRWTVSAQLPPAPPERP